MAEGGSLDHSPLAAEMGIGVLHCPRGVGTGESRSPNGGHRASEIALQVRRTVGFLCSPLIL